jgi:hypothetical protein
MTDLLAAVVAVAAWVGILYLLTRPDPTPPISKQAINRARLEQQRRRRRFAGR